MPDEEKTEISRRSFLKTTATGAAAVGAIAAAPTILSVAENAAGALPAGESGTTLMAFVRDASKGEVVVMWGTKEFVARDTALVSRLATYTRE